MKQTLVALKKNLVVILLTGRPKVWILNYVGLESSFPDTNQPLFDGDGWRNLPRLTVFAFFFPSTRDFLARYWCSRSRVGRLDRPTVLACYRNPTLVAPTLISDPVVVVPERRWEWSS